MASSSRITRSASIALADENQLLVAVNDGLVLEKSVLEKKVSDLKAVLAVVLLEKTGVECGLNDALNQLLNSELLVAHVYGVVAEKDELIALLRLDLADALAALHFPPGFGPGSNGF